MDRSTDISVKELRQRSLFHGKRSFRLSKDSGIELSTSEWFTLNEYRLDLDLFDPDPSRYRHWNMPSLIAFVIFAVLTALACWGALLMNLPSDRASMWVVVAAMGICTLISILRFIIKSSNVLLFYNRNNGKALVSLLYGKPTMNEFTDFVNAMSSRIKEAVATDEEKQRSKHIPQLEELFQLKQKGILTEEEFAAAKHKLLQSLGPSSVGFGAQ
jgi:hypothetical protein